MSASITATIHSREAIAVFLYISIPHDTLAPPQSPPQPPASRAGHAAPRRLRTHASQPRLRSRPAISDAGFETLIRARVRQKRKSAGAIGDESSQPYHTYHRSLMLRRKYDSVLSVDPPTRCHIRRSHRVSATNITTARSQPSTHSKPSRPVNRIHAEGLLRQITRI